MNVQEYHDYFLQINTAFAPALGTPLTDLIIAAEYWPTGGTKDVSNDELPSSPFEFRIR